MAVGDGGFRTRAASLLRSPKPSPTVEPMNEKHPLDEPETSLPPSSAGKTSELQSDLAVTDDIDPNRIIRTIPSRLLLAFILPLLIPHHSLGTNLLRRR